MKKLIVITGPTASGKTKLSVLLARHFKSEIINADSRQFYRKMDIGTAKPGFADLQSIPHHFIDFLDVTENYNAGRFEADAISKTEELFRKHEVVFVTGGSGLYIDALCYGIDELPEASVELREELNTMLESGGIDSLRNKLKEADEEYYAVADLNNPRRIIRALEVIYSSGKKFLELRKNNAKPRNFDVKKIGILVDRDDLYQSINMRVDEMMQKGLVEEVKKLLSFRKTNALQTVGYREIFEFLDNKISLGTAVELIKQNTRNYAKRQMTWFRRDPDIHWFSVEETGKIIRFIEQ